jgi:hypothetical protein
MATRPQKRFTTSGKAINSPTRRLETRKPKRPGRDAEKPEVRIFISYSHADASAQARLQTHLAALTREGVSIWFDGDMDAGDALDSGVAGALRRAHIFVALLSPDYLASRYCWNIEYRRAMNRRARGTMRVVAAVVRPCDWKATRAARFKLLPRDGRPVTRWRSADDAFLDIAEGIRGVVRALRRDMTAAPVKLSGTASSPKKKPDSVSSSRVTGRPKTNKARARSRKGAK